MKCSKWQEYAYNGHLPGIKILKQFLAIHFWLFCFVFNFFSFGFDSLRIHSSSICDSRWLSIQTNKRKNLLNHFKNVEDNNKIRTAKMIESNKKKTENQMIIWTQNEFYIYKHWTQVGRKRWAHQKQKTWKTFFFDPKRSKDGSIFSFWMEKWAKHSIFTNFLEIGFIDFSFLTWQCPMSNVQKNWLIDFFGES